MGRASEWAALPTPSAPRRLPAGQQRTAGWGVRPAGAGVEVEPWEEGIRGVPLCELPPPQI